MHLAVIGTGYVGLVSGVCFSEFGYTVTCIDRDEGKITGLKNGKMPIYEPGLDELVETNVRAGRLYFSTDLAKSIEASDIVFIAVGTPAGADGMPDMTALNTVAEQLAPLLSSRYRVVVVKSTVPVNTVRTLGEKLSALNPDADFDVASNPEFLREGSAIEDFMTPDRIVIGVDSPRSREMLTRLYDPICLNGAPLFVTSFESAELIKYASNSLLATKIAFINEISDMCEKLGANIRDVSHGVGMDSRIGASFLQPGPGYGGSCFPKDTLALTTMARNAGVPATIVEQVIESNEQRKSRMADKIIESLDGDVNGKEIAVLGLTFKPGTDDMRDASSLVILPKLLEAGATLRAYDPQGMQEAKHMLKGDIKWCNDAYEAMSGVDAVVILTEWNEFRRMDLARVRESMKNPLIIDLRNVYKRRDMQTAGIRYISIGRAPAEPGEPWIQDLNPAEEAA